METKAPSRLPPWLRRPIQTDRRYAAVHSVLRDCALHTVCEDARCPNRHECWNAGTATFMILGNICTRNCRFCNVQSGNPLPPDPDEPRRVAEAAEKLGLRHVVITSVTRDDLPNGGAEWFARTVQAVRERLPEASVEVLTPDFGGDLDALHTVFDVRPDVFNHNIETVERLQKEIRGKASYRRSLDVLRAAAERGGMKVKSGLMVGLGERDDEIEQAMRDLYAAGVRLLTVGQYLAPSREHLHTRRFVSPAEFARLEALAREIGFTAVAAAPLVRSSYHAREMAAEREDRTP